MSMYAIRKRYDVPAKRGQRVQYLGGLGIKRGVITGSDGFRLRIRLDGDAQSRRFHPTYCVVAVVHLPAELCTSDARAVVGWYQTTTTTIALDW